MAMTKSSAHARPLRSSRGRPIDYRESGTEESEQEEEQSGASTSEDEAVERPSKRLRLRAPKQRPSSSTRSLPTRSSRRTVQYQEPSSEDNEEDSTYSSGPDDQSAAPGRRSKHAKPGATAVQSAKAAPSARAAEKTRTRTRRKRTRVNVGDNGRNEAKLPKVQRKAQKLLADPPRPIESDGIIPPWSTLPYAILMEIFKYAAFPLHDENFLASPSINWLVSVAGTCRAFMEPALSALYETPPMVSSDRPHKLLQLLTLPPESRLINYNVKVKHLEMDWKTLAYTAPGMGHFDITSLFPLLPRLETLEIFSTRDRPPYRYAAQGIRWHYPQTLFDSLTSAGVRLRHWRWNSAMHNKEQGLSWMESVHRTESFQHVEELNLHNYRPSSHTSRKASAKASEAPLDEITNEILLGHALSVLPNLTTLGFENCLVFNDELLPLLPKNLTSLSITNCYALEADDLRGFLTTHGQALKRLILDHNQSLDISFLQVLREACPLLEVLKMDMNYYGSTDTHNDSEPRYTILLKEDEVPTWPSTLQELDLVHLRNWSSAAAVMFFTSLVGAAENLPVLRKLVLRAILDIPWRERATFRDEWIGRLNHVFLRRRAPPVPYLASFKEFRKWKGSKDGQFSALVSATRPGSVVRRLSHVTIPPRQRVSTEESSDGPSSSMRRSQRIAAQTPSQDATEEDSSAASSSEDEVHHHDFIQGMCTVVDVRMDNLRPADTLYTEADFMDEEVSGDEDWNGEDVEDFSRTYRRPYAW